VNVETESPRVPDRGRVIAWTAFIAFIAALNYAARFAGSGKTANNDAAYSYGQFAGGILVYALWLGAVLWIAGFRRDLLALRRPRSWPRAAALAVGAIFAIYVVEGVVSLIPLPQSPGKEQGLAPTHWEPAHAGAFAANMVLFAVIAPFVEELTFRGVGQSLLSFLGRWPSIVLVGLAFGLAHGLLEALLVLVPFGIALAWLRNRTTSVYPGMVVHGLFNGAALLIAAFG
jgi:membrane protease YdiL (CAAX protease family)